MDQEAQQSEAIKEEVDLAFRLTLSHLQTLSEETAHNMVIATDVAISMLVNCLGDDANRDMNLIADRLEFLVKGVVEKLRKVATAAAH